MNVQLRNSADSRRGSAIIAGVFVVLVVSVLSMSYLQLSLNKNREHASAVDAKRAFYMAEAGLAEGYAALVAGKSGVVASPEQPAVYANGVFWVEATKISPTRTRLQSTGISGTGRDSLTIVIERTTRTLADVGLFGDEGVRVGLGSSIESYDSRVGDVDGGGGGGIGGIGGVGGVLPNADGGVIFDSGESRLRIGSNQDITLIGDRDSTTTVEGDVIPGPSGSVVIGPGITINGSTAPADAVATLKTITPPEARDAGSFAHIRNENYVHPPSFCKYDSMSIAAGKVTVKGPTKIVVNSLNVAAGAELEFDTTDGPVKMYVRDSVNMVNGSMLSSVEQDPTQLMFMIGASDGVDGDGNDVNAVNMRASGEFYGFMYSPSADLRLNPTLDFYGTMIGKEVVLEPGAQFHFDEALLDALSDGSQIDSDLLSWRFVPLPDAEIVRTRIEPIKWLLLKGKALNKPSETHDDDWDGEVDNSDIISNRNKEFVVN